MNEPRTTRQGIAARILTGALAFLVAVVGLVTVCGPGEVVDSVEINADRARLPICTIAEDLPPTPFARSRPLLAAGGTITDDYPASLKEAYERFRGESEATDGLPVEGGEAEAAQAAANARFEEAIAQFCD